MMQQQQQHSLLPLLLLLLFLAAADARPPGTGGASAELRMWPVLSDLHGPSALRFVCSAADQGDDAGHFKVRLHCQASLGVCYENCVRTPLCAADPVCAASTCTRRPTSGGGGGFDVGYSFPGLPVDPSVVYQCRYRHLSRSLEFHFTTPPTTATTEGTSTTATKTAATTATTTAATTATTTASQVSTASTTAVLALSATAGDKFTADDVTTARPEAKTAGQLLGGYSFILILIIFLSILAAGLIALLAALFICQSRKLSRSAAAAAAASTRSKSSPAVPNEYCQLPPESNIYEDLQYPHVELVTANSAEVAAVVELPAEDAAGDEREAAADDVTERLPVERC